MFNVDKKVSVQLFLLVQSGTYEDQMIRPFETNVGRDLKNALTESTQGGLNIGISAIEGVAGQILKPQATTQGRANIVNGWRERRYRFMMKVEERNPVDPHQVIKRIFFGYSDSYDPSYGGHVDPNMRIFFNSETTLACQWRQNQQGGYWDVQPIGSNQIVTPIDMGSAPGAQSAFGNRISHLIRPDDIFNYGHTSQVISKLQQYGNLDPNSSVEVLDQRSIVGEGGTYQYSRRHDTSPSRYLHKTLLGYSHAQKEAALENHFGYDKEMIYTEAKNRIANEYIHKVTFFQLLKEQAGYMEKGYVTFSELQQIFPETASEQVTIPAADTGRSIRQVNFAEDSEHWRGSNEITIAASSIAQIVPAIMMDNLLRAVAVNVTNGSGPGNYRIEYIPNSVRAIEDNLYLAPHLAEFERRLQVDLLNVITMNNQVSFDLSVGSDLSGDTKIMIRLGAEGPLQFIAPTFIDSLFTPVITSDAQRKDKISSDLLYLLDEVIPEQTNVGHAYQAEPPAFEHALLNGSTTQPTQPTQPTTPDPQGPKRFTGLL